MPSHPKCDRVQHRLHFTVKHPQDVGSAMPICICIPRTGPLKMQTLRARTTVVPWVYTFRIGTTKTKQREAYQLWETGCIQYNAQLLRHVHVL